MSGNHTSVLLVLVCWDRWSPLGRFYLNVDLNHNIIVLPEYLSCFPPCHTTLVKSHTEYMWVQWKYLIIGSSNSSNSNNSNNSSISLPGCRRRGTSKRLPAFTTLPASVSPSLACHMTGYLRDCKSSWSCSMLFWCDIMLSAGNPLFATPYAAR